MITHYSVTAELSRQRRTQITETATACQPLTPRPRRRLSARVTVVAAALAAVTASGAGTAAAHPDFEQPTTASYAASQIPILHSNVPVDAWTQERFFYGGRLDMLTTEIPITKLDVQAAERHFDHRFGR